MTTRTVRVECSCRICSKNAARLGKPAPLAAMTTALAASAVKGDYHGLVYLAHDPVLGAHQSTVSPL